ncbi:MAG: hypothetical protein C5B59_07415 [Bacteroidetes bacterium]|nr:MAG: hypothetical protein C5B59_07415 [Bacteroidota bacterium]
MELFDKLFNPKRKDTFPPKPKWKPNLPTDIDLIYEKTRYYTCDKLQFAIFQNGTVTIFPERVDDVGCGAISFLEKIYNFHADFKPMTMGDGNYLIGYSQPAFSTPQPKKCSLERL